MQPEEGKTTISVNIAVSFANAGFRTLLIDADIQKSWCFCDRLSANETAHQGLTSSSDSNAELSEMLLRRNWRKPNLMIIPAGQAPPNPKPHCCNKISKGRLN